MSLELLKRYLDNVFPEHLLPTCLAKLPANHKRQMCSTMANDEGSTNAEMVEFWIARCGIPAAAAAEAIKHRASYRRNSYFELFSDASLKVPPMPACATPRED
jgi:hypothetical protein